jgi:hypothetical protein
MQKSDNVGVPEDRGHPVRGVDYRCKPEEFDRWFTTEATYTEYFLLQKAAKVSPVPSKQLLDRTEQPDRNTT